LILGCFLGSARGRLASKPGLESLLVNWSNSSDRYLSGTAIRALASLKSESISGAKYAEGVHLLYPNVISEQVLSEADQFDVVLIHGVRGDPVTTWRSVSDDQGL
jgi:hypothetical protein